MDGIAPKKVALWIQGKAVALLRIVKDKIVGYVTEYINRSEPGSSEDTKEKQEDSRRNSQMQQLEQDLDPVYSEQDAELSSA
jgi:hypothetical protein